LGFFLEKRSQIPKKKAILLRGIEKGKSNTFGIAIALKTAVTERSPAHIREAGNLFF
jgi:hypothetical protein